MADYSFLTTWRFDAPMARVWDELTHPERWSEWWPGVHAVSQVAPGGAHGVGARFANRWRSVLPHTVEFTTTVVAVDEPHLIEVVSSGELEGVGRWRLYEGAGVAVTFEWIVRTTPAWINALSLVAKPLFAWNHEVIMRRGERGLRARLAASKPVWTRR